MTIEYKYAILTEQSNHLASLFGNEEQTYSFNYNEITINIIIQRDNNGKDISHVKIISSTESKVDKIINRLCLVLSKSQNYSYYYYPELIRRTEMLNEGERGNTSQLLFRVSTAIVSPVNQKSLESLFINTPSLNLEVSYLFKNGLRNMQNNEYCDAFILIYISLEKFMRNNVGYSMISSGKTPTERCLYDMLIFAKNDLGYKIDIRGFEDEGIFRKIRNDIIHGLGDFGIIQVASQVKQLISAVLSIFVEFDS
ncbi:MAG: hypothetical protein HeimC2_40330 [Candidatus Heimdallarchaeota archaeon LC_2]|nr:MAG: hypothetical protein HeimC2_40330 [Candidatus Heimdallarchaeota archaeon LC_2]